MKAALRMRGVTGLARRLERDGLERAASQAVVETAAALADGMAQAAGATAEVSGSGARRRVAVTDPEAIRRETGARDQAPAPWLAATLFALARRRP